MNATSEQIDTIVREVIRRIQETNETPADATSQSTLAVPDRVVTLATLDRKLDGVSILQVSSKAVVTPAVIDLLKEKSVRLKRRGKESKQNCSKVVLAADANCQESNQVAGWLHDRGWLVEQLAGGSIEALASELARRHVTATIKSIAVTSRPFYFTALINRHEAVRAALALNSSMAKQATEEMDANVLVMDAGQTCPKIINTYLGNH